MTYEFSATLEYNVCACALQGRQYLDEIMGAVDAEEFTESDAKALFLAIQDAYNSGMAEINYQTVFLRSQPILSALGFGGRHYLEVTRSDSTTKLDAKSTVELFREQSRKVRLQRLADRIMEQVRNNVGSDDIMLQAQQGLTNMTKCSRDSVVDPFNGAIITATDILDQLDADNRNKGRILTCYGKLNDMTGGFDGGSLTILSAPTGGGKSAFAMNIAYQVGMVQKIPCLYINSELSRKQMSFRWGAILAEIPHHDIRRGSFEDKADRVLPVMERRFSKGQCYSLTMPDLRIDSAMMEIRMMHATRGIRMAIIDYIGRMDTLGSNAKDWEILYSGARWLKTLAQELNIAIIMVAQLDGSGERLARASYMQQEADTWINLHRCYEKDDAKWLQDNRPWNVIVELKKSRNSESNTGFLMYFNGATMTFTDQEEEALQLIAKGETGRWKTS